MSIEFVVSVVCIILGAMVVGVTLYRIVRGEPIGRWTYAFCALGAVLVVFPVTHTFELLDAGQEARRELGNLVNVLHGQGGPQAEAPVPEPVPVPTPTPVPGATASSPHLASAVRGAERATRAYDEVTAPIPVRAFKKIFN